MSRRKKSLLEDLLEIATILPWKIDIAIAVAAYFGLHGIAATEVVATAQPGNIGKLVGAQLLQTLASVGQYLIPIVFLAGAAFSMSGRKKREHLLSQTKQRGKQNALLDMSWREFEMLVGEVFRQRGFTVLETGGNGPDGGIDLILKKNNETHLVQCKQWKAFKVGVNIVRELFGVMAAKGAVSGFVVTSGVFTNEAKEFAAGRNIELIDGAKLTQLVNGVKARSAATQQAGYREENQPSCPKCGNAMSRRMARQGSNAGKEFWGCSQFPSCKGIRSI